MSSKETQLLLVNDSEQFVNDKTYNTFCIQIMQCLLLFMIVLPYLNVY